MTKLSLRERFVQRGQTRRISPVQVGFPETLSLRLSGNLSDTKAVLAVIALRRRGVPTLKAKRAIEAAIEQKFSVLDVPTVEDRHALAEDLKRFGFDMSVVSGSPSA